VGWDHLQMALSRGNYAKRSSPDVEELRPVVVFRPLLAVSFWRSLHSEVDPREVMAECPGEYRFCL
jgi:hypothetical protein